MHYPHHDLEMEMDQYNPIAENSSLLSLPKAHTDLLLYLSKSGVSGKAADNSIHETLAICLNHEVSKIKVRTLSCQRSSDHPLTSSQERIGNTLDKPCSKPN